MNSRIYLISSLLFTILFTYTLKPGEFIFLNDQLFPFSFAEAASRSYFIFRSGNLGYISSWQSIIQFWDLLFFLFVYKLNINFIWAEKLHFFAILFVTQYFSYLGFYKLNDLLELRLSKYRVFLVGLLYAFNPYVMELWHGGVFNLGSALTYSLAPLIIYYFHLSVFTKSGLRTKLVCSLLMFFASFVFWLFAVIVFFLGLYSVLRLILQRGQGLLLYIKNALMLGFLYLPLATIVIFSILYRYTNIGGSRDPLAQPAFGNISGGILYQLKFLFSWGIYNVWSPRTLYFFGDYFFTKYYDAGIILLYVFIIGGIAATVFTRIYTKHTANKFLSKILQKNDRADIKPILIFSAIFIVSAFFAKAGQPPFGEIFVFLYHHAPFFQVFRTPDIRFGFAMLLCLAILSLYSARYLKKVPFVLLMLTIILLLSWHFINGSAVAGLNVEKNGVQYIDRIVSIPSEYKEMAEIIDGLEKDSSYVLSIPSVNSGYFDLNESGIYIGQDLMPKITGRNFIYTSSDSTRIYSDINTQIINALNENNAEAIRNFPIKYILYRKDVDCESCPSFSKDTLTQNFKLIHQNELLEFYEINNSTPVIDAPQTVFTQVSPTKYIVDFNNITEPVDLNFLQGYNFAWNLYPERIDSLKCEHIVGYQSNSECYVEITPLDFRNIKYIFNDSVFNDSRIYSGGYWDKWQISPETVKANFKEGSYVKNEDGSINFRVVIYYKDQAYYLLAFLTSGVLLVLYSILVFKMRSDVIAR